ncbi:Zinc/iron permease [Kalaharituber pfeilii]|nr:Zinc/iron permease [Kalaharituber pfeilii]
MASVDARGWILSTASGLACVIGSSIICIDLFTRYIPRFRDFNIRKNTTFLSASLSLSFGVMIFSALYGILPEASVYLINSGKSAQTAHFMSIVFFMVGVTGLSIISEILHRSLPSSIVHCEHVDGSKHIHGLDEESECESEHSHHHHGHHGHDHGHYHDHNTPNGPDQSSRKASCIGTDGVELVDEVTPLLSNKTISRRPSLKVRLSESVTSLVTGKVTCTGDGTCYGYSDTRPCDRMCLPHIKAVRKPLTVNETGNSSTELLLEIDGTRENDLERGRPVNGSASLPIRRRSTASLHSHDHSGHHHIPKNEYLSIGLQTSLAIALHKIPEGFITFATNHANPTLGFAVFLALFIHNITEGFAMSLPLFLAFKSRFTAILWASLLGGLSQPVGAFVAWLWLKAHKGGPPSEVGYGILFAVTAGIMSNVAVQLFGQAVSIYHNLKVPVIFAFLGMGILGISSAMNE